MNARPTFTTNIRLHSCFSFLYSFYVHVVYVRSLSIWVKLHTFHPRDVCTTCVCVSYYLQLARAVAAYVESLVQHKVEKEWKGESEIHQRKGTDSVFQIDIFISSALMRFPFNRKLFPPHDFFRSFFAPKILKSRHSCRQTLIFLDKT